MQELLFGLGFIAVLFIGVVAIKKEGHLSLRSSKTVSKMDVERIMRKKPEERTLADNIAIKIFEAQSTNK